MMENPNTVHYMEEHNEYVQKLENILSTKAIPEETYIEGTELKDSGKRENFDTGAVRDDDATKGNEYLLPFDVVGEFLSRVKRTSHIWVKDFGDPFYIFNDLECYKRTGDIEHLYQCLIGACIKFYDCDPELMIMEVAIHYKQGAKKYAPRNWEKGMPISRFIDSAIRHYLKAIRGDKDEPHERAFVWNIMGAIHIIGIKPSLNDFVLTKQQLSDFGYTVDMDEIKEEGIREGGVENECTRC